MAKPLFSQEEVADYERGLNAAKDWPQKDALKKAHQIEEVRRAQKRPQEFLDALLLLIGSRGTTYITFDDAFSKSDELEYRKAVSATNTPETRRSLYTILKALTEIPRSWATSAFLRFLRGTGKQKDTNYHGMGTFGVRYGWKEDEVKTICEVLTGGHWHNNPYCSVLMSYSDVSDEIADDDPDYEVVDYQATFAATRVNRDVAFLEKLCSLLDTQGLGPVPTPAEEKPKKDRKTKQFHSGDIIRKSNLRDLPLPAHIQLPIERLDEASGQWVASTIQKVVTGLETGRYIAAIVHSNGKDAYFENDYYRKWGRDKYELEGATFLGTWPTAISDKKYMEVKFRFRVLRRSS